MVKLVGQGVVIHCDEDEMAMQIARALNNVIKLTFDFGDSIPEPRRLSKSIRPRSKIRRPSLDKGNYRIALEVLLHGPCTDHKVGQAMEERDRSYTSAGSAMGILYDHHKVEKLQTMEGRQIFGISDEGQAFCREKNIHPFKWKNNHAA